MVWLESNSAKSLVALCLNDVDIHVGKTDSLACGLQSTLQTETLQFFYIITLGMISPTC